MKKLSPLSALLMILPACLLVTGCATVFSAPTASLQLYQPPVLHLKAGLPVQTVDGIYTPQVDETWHSDARFQAVENEAINAAAALVQKNNTTP